MKLTVELTEDQAMALAQMCKRFLYEDAQRFGNRFDNGREADLILDAVSRIQRGLKQEGFAPR